VLPVGVAGQQAGGEQGEGGEQHLAGEQEPRDERASHGHDRGGDVATGPEGVDYFLRIAVADHAAYEAFLTGKLIGLPGVLHVTSHLTMKKIKVDG